MIDFMRVLPFRRFSVDVDMGKEPLVSSLPKFLFRREDAWAGVERFTGKAFAEGFRIRRCIEGRNDGRGVFVGRFEDLPGERTRVHVLIRLHYLALAYLCVYMSLLGGACFWCVVLEAWQGALFMLGFMLLMFGMVDFAFFSDLPKSKRLFMWALEECNQKRAVTTHGRTF